MNEDHALRTAGYISEASRNLRVGGALVFGVAGITIAAALAGYSAGTSILIGLLVGCLYARLTYSNIERRNLKARALANQVRR